MARMVLSSAAVPASILILEDDPVVGFAVEDYLSHEGFTVTRTTTVQEAYRALSGSRHDLLLADLRLGATDTLEGLDVAAAALSSRRVDHAVVVTAFSTDGTVARAAVLGVAAVVNKPVPLPELAALITRLVAQRDPED